MMEHAVIFEYGPTSIGAYVPDLPGCVAVGATLDETRHLIAEAIALHLEGMHEDRGAPVCGQDFCDACGDCLSCYGEDPCPDGPTHQWVIEDDTCQ